MNTFSANSNNSGKIMIRYQAVYSKVTELRRRIESELNEMDASYRQLQSSLENMDGSAHATILSTMEENRIKAQITSETLHRLVSFMELSARRVEQDELTLKGMYALASQKAEVNPTANNPT